MCGSACTGEGRYAPARGERGTRVWEGVCTPACAVRARAEVRECGWRGGRAGKEVCSGVQVSPRVEAWETRACEGRQVRVRACGVSGSLGGGGGLRGRTRGEGGGRWTRALAT